MSKPQPGLRFTSKDESINSDMDIAEKVNSMLSTYKKGDISSDLARSMLLYLRMAAKTVKELRVVEAYASCIQVSSVKI